MTRDEFISDRPAMILDSYNDQVLPWGLSHRDAWKQNDIREYIAGGMVWTGFDYRGEPQPLSWPAAGSSFGIMNLCGFPKFAFWLHQARWITDRPILHIAPHWNWAGNEGKRIQVMVATNADHVDLLLNGKPVGSSVVDKYEMATFAIPYTPGRLEARASNAGKEVARSSVQTTGAPTALRLVPDRTSLAGDGIDAKPITVEVVDSYGQVVPTANAEVTFTQAGPAAIIGLNNGDPTNHESEQVTRHSVFHGLGQAIVQTELEGSGSFVIYAASPGFTPAHLSLAVKPVVQPPVIAEIANPPLAFLNWRRSPASMDRPDPNEQLLSSDMNSWVSVRPTPWLSPLRNGRFVISRYLYAT